MLSNLFTSLLLATAVGGTTANSFDNKPKQAITIEQEQLESDNQTAINILINTNNVEASNVDTTGHTYTTYNQTLSNNAILQITASIYINNYTSYNPQTGSQTTAIGTIYSIYKLDLWNSYELDSQRINQIVNVQTTTSNENSWSLRQNYKYAVADISNTNAYDSLVNRVIRSDTNWQTLEDDFNLLYNASTEKTSSQNLYSATGQSIDQNVYTPSYYNVQTDSNHVIIMVRQSFAQYGTYMHPTSSLITYNSSLHELVVHPNTNVGNIEVIDIPGMMYTILTMPFSFVSQAFNLTIFAGTAYALNFRDIILVILGTLITLLLVRIIFKFMR